MEDNNKEDLMFTPENEDKQTKSPILRYVAIGVIGIALLEVLTILVINTLLNNE